jgi:beta-galactosidase
MPILDLIGAKISFYDVLPAPNVAKIKSGDKTYDWAAWGEILAPNEGTAALATYADQYYAGGVGAITRKLGKGSVTYIGCESLDGGLEAALIKGVFDRASVPTMNLEENFLVDWRDGFWVATNYTEKKLTIPAAANVNPIIGSRELGPAGVAVWKD